MSVAALLSLSLTGCTPDVYLPPARVLPLESAATLGTGETGIQLEGGEHGAILGVSAWSGALRVRHGIDDGTDASAEVSVLHVNGSGGSVDTYPDVFAARGGIKHRITPGLSLTGGVGGGASTGGGFLSPDVGAVAAYENPYFVPFFAVRGGFSVPFDERPVDTGAKTGPAEPPFTWNGGAVAGVRVPIGWCAPTACDTRGSLLAGVGLTLFAYSGGEDSPQGVMSVAAGGELVF